MLKILYCDISNVKLDEVKNLVLPKLRGAYVAGINDEKRKIQSILVWKLLEYGFSLYNLVDAEFFLEENGKWSLLCNEKIKFSLAHSHNIVAVAISDDGCVGLDVEKISEKILPTKKLYTDDKIYKVLEKYPNFNLIEVLTFLWTEKESAFKVDTVYDFYAKKITDEIKNSYILTVCSKCSAAVEQISLDKII